jgi:hypothetical protein
MMESFLFAFMIGGVIAAIGWMLIRRIEVDTEADISGRKT